MTDLGSMGWKKMKKATRSGCFFSGLCGLQLLHYDAFCDCAARRGVLQQVYALGGVDQTDGVALVQSGELVALVGTFHNLFRQLHSKTHGLTKYRNLAKG